MARRAAEITKIADIADPRRDLRTETSVRRPATASARGPSRPKPAATNHHPCATPHRYRNALDECGTMPIM